MIYQDNLVFFLLTGVNVFPQNILHILWCHFLKFDRHTEGDYTVGLGCKDAKLLFLFQGRQKVIHDMQTNFLGGYLYL